MGILKTSNHLPLWRERNAIFARVARREGMPLWFRRNWLFARNGSSRLLSRIDTKPLFHISHVPDHTEGVHEYTSKHGGRSHGVDISFFNRRSKRSSRSSSPLVVFSNCPAMNSSVEISIRANDSSAWIPPLWRLSVGMHFQERLEPSFVVVPSTIHSFGHIELVSFFLINFFQYVRVPSHRIEYLLVPVWKQGKGSPRRTTASRPSILPIHSQSTYH